MSYNPGATDSQFLSAAVPMWTFLTITGIAPATGGSLPRDIATVSIPSNVLVYRLLGDTLSNVPPYFHILYAPASSGSMADGCVQVRNGAAGSGDVVLGAAFSGSFVQLPSGQYGMQRMSVTENTGVLRDRTLYLFQSGKSASTGLLNMYLGIMPVLFQ